MCKQLVVTTCCLCCQLAGGDDDAPSAPALEQEHSQLLSKVAQLQQENEATLGKLRAHDDAAKKALNQLQADLQSKLSQVSRISC